MLKQIRIKGFKSVEDTKIELGPLVVIFGPNAAGKSNLVDALVLLSRLVTEQTLADAYAPPLRGYPVEAFTLPKGGLEDLLGLEEAVQSFEVVVHPNGKKRLPKPAQSLRYRVGVRINPASGDLSVADEFLVGLKKDGSQALAPQIERDGDQLTIRRLREAGRPRIEQLGANHCVASNLQFTGEQYPEFDALRGELRSWRSYYLDPRIVMREAQPPKEVTDIGPHGELLAPFLYRLEQSADYGQRFHAVRRALHAAIPAIDGLDVDLDRRRGTLDIRIIQDGTPFSSRVVSEGTLRVLALCAIAANPWPSSLVAFEEPENGVHPRRISVVAELLQNMVASGDRQVIVTTHSPTLVAQMLAKQREASDQPDRGRTGGSDAPPWLARWVTSKSTSSVKIWATSSLCEAYSGA